MTTLSDFKFRLEAILDNNEARQCFLEFLQESCNAETLLFFMQVEEYSRLRLDENRFARAKEIMNEFIVVKAPHELNLSGSIRTNVIDQFSQIESKANETNEVECPASLFQQVQDVCFGELRDDSFPRFVRSDNFKKLITRETKRDSKYLTKIGTRKSQLGHSDSRNSFVGIDDLNVIVLGEPEPYITEGDILLAQSLTSELNSRTWSTVTDANDHQIYISKDLVQVGSDTKSLVKVSRTDYIIPFEAIDILYALCDSAFHMKLDPTLKESKLVEYRTDYNNTKLSIASSILFQKRKFPLCATRQVLSAAALIPMKYNKETKEFEQFMLVMKAVEHPDYPVPKGTQSLTTVRAKNFVVQTITKIGPNMSAGQLVLAVDPKGFLNSSSLLKMANKRRKAFLDNCTHALREKSRLGTLGKKPVNSDGLLDGLKYYVQCRSEQFPDRTHLDD